MADTETVLKLISRQDLVEYTAAETGDSFLDIEADERKNLSDQEAKKILHQVAGCSSASDFQKMAKPEREKCYRALYERGISISQISRITGRSRPLVYRALGK